ncbi:hypothetical protein DPMN_143421 [Dreissena polymorpha]|uniref:Uncharacterized protein n=1 Tax=Dreissena polymorpha TaxID=45954 RepID=A0A9D4GG82_DREPO|nr:hypothetical protein DPMN_143421 [Dreissena polymorpha]
MEKLLPCEMFRDDTPMLKMQLIRAGIEAVDEYLREKSESASTTAPCKCKCGKQIPTSPKSKPGGKLLTSDKDVILFCDTPSNDGEQIQLLTKFGEDRMKFRDRPTDRRTDQQNLLGWGMGYCLGGIHCGIQHKRLGSSNEFRISVLSIVSMNEPHWKTMRISGIKPLWKTMRISGIKPGIRTEESVLSIVSMKEPGIKPGIKPGISTDTVQPTRNKRISRSAAARQNEAMPLQSLKPPQYARRHATISDMMPNIIGTNLLTKFHKYRKINVASRVLTRKNAPPPGSHVFQPTGIIF